MQQNRLRERRSFSKRKGLLANSAIISAVCKSVVNQANITKGEIARCAL